MGRDPRFLAEMPTKSGARSHWPWASAIGWDAGRRPGETPNPCSNRSRYRDNPRSRIRLRASAIVIVRSRKLISISLPCIFIARVMERTREAKVYGVRPARTFEQAAAKFVLDHQHKRSLSGDVGRLKGLMPAIGNVPLDNLHMGILQTWIEQRRRRGVAVGTINHGLQVVRRILNLAASEWMDERGLTWIRAPAKIKLLPNHLIR
jgi:hypothetical protein